MGIPHRPNSYLRRSRKLIEPTKSQQLRNQRAAEGWQLIPLSVRGYFISNAQVIREGEEYEANLRLMSVIEAEVFPYLFDGPTLPKPINVFSGGK